jgi:hypothetical protein
VEAIFSCFCRRRDISDGRESREGNLNTTTVVLPAMAGGAIHAKVSCEKFRNRVPLNRILPE